MMKKMAVFGASSGSAILRTKLSKRMWRLTVASQSFSKSYSSDLILICDHDVVYFQRQIES